MRVSSASARTRFQVAIGHLGQIGQVYSFGFVKGRESDQVLLLGGGQLGEAVTDLLGFAGSITMTTKHLSATSGNVKTTEKACLQ